MMNWQTTPKNDSKVLTSRILVMLVTILFVFSNNAFAVKFSTSSFKQTIKVGLVNMSSTTIKVTLSNYYDINPYDLVYTPGTSFTLEAAGGKLKYNNGSISTSSSSISSADSNNGISDEIVFTPLNQGDTIKLEVGAKKYFYKGSISFKVQGEKIVPVNTIDIEIYLKGVVGYEMSNSYPIEALKAQAIAARNYALISMGKHGKDGYDLCDTTDCQVYKGDNSSYLNVINAVDQTKGKVLVYGDELVGAYYSASSGGYTEASGNIWSQQLPYLIAKMDEFETEAWPYGPMNFTTLEIDTKLKAKKVLKPTDTFVSIDLSSIKINESGRVNYLELLYLNSAGTESRKVVSKEGPRTFLSLPSSLYTVVYDLNLDTYHFEGKGYGHGVGMSQIGARNRAKAGQTYAQILSFYYDGSKVVDINGSIKNDEDLTQDLPQSNGGSTTDSSIKTPSNNTNSNVKSDSNNKDIIPIPKPSVDDKKTTQSAVGVNPNDKKNEDGNINSVPKPNVNTIKINSIAKIENYDFTRVLKKGMTGNDVKKLQDLLKKLKYFSATKTTTYFGATTETSIKAFQKKQKIKVNGVADKNTFVKLGKQLVTVAKNTNVIASAKTKTNTNSKTKTKIVQNKNKLAVVAINKKESMKTNQ